MRAYVLRQYGGADAALLMDVPVPSLRPGDVLIAVRAAGLNPVDYKFRQGKLRVIYRPRLPLVLGNEVAGEVIAIGEKVTHFSTGDRVFARVEKDRLGAFAEQVAVDEACVARMPADLDFATAAAVPLAALTALQALRDELGVKAGQNVFISGGAGGVGTFAIQIAKWLGARVTTTASPRGEALVRALGADEVIDYTAVDPGKIEKKFDAGLDLVGGDVLGQMMGNRQAGKEAGLGGGRARTADRAARSRGQQVPGGSLLACQFRRQAARAPGWDHLSISLHAPERARSRPARFPDRARNRSRRHRQDIRVRRDRRSVRLPRKRTGQGQGDDPILA